MQTLRSQVALYQLQHNGKLPCDNAGTFDSTKFWNQMTLFTDVSGNTNATSSTTFPYGPYMQSIPANALNTNQTVIDGAVAPPGSAASACGYELDFTQGTGRVYGTDIDGTTLLP